MYSVVFFNIYQVNDELIKKFYQIKVTKSYRNNRLESFLMYKAHSQRQIGISFQACQLCTFHPFFGYLQGHSYILVPRKWIFYLFGNYFNSSIAMKVHIYLKVNLPFYILLSFETWWNHIRFCRCQPIRVECNGQPS